MQIMLAVKNMVRVVSMCGYFLQTHAVQHTGEKPYQCPHCPRTFASSGNYHKHKKRMHASERLYNLTWVVSFRRKSRHALYSTCLVPAYRNSWIAASANMNVPINIVMYFSECESFVIVTETAIFVCYGISGWTGFLVSWVALWSDSHFSCLCEWKNAPFCIGKCVLLQPVLYR